MTTLAVWQVSGTEPRLLASAQVDLEKQLEEWIERQPDLVQFGLTIVGRQVRVSAGPIDLLALDPQGRWCVIEIKRDLVDRNTLAQVQDYAACLNEMSEEELRAALATHLRDRGLDLDELLGKCQARDTLEPNNREVVMFVVGTRRSPGLDRLIRFLAGRHEMPFQVTIFNVYETSQGDRVLVREASEDELPQPPEDRWQSSSLESMRALAEKGGFGEVFDTLGSAAANHALKPRPRKHGVMYSPPTNGRRCLFTVWAPPQAGGLQTYVSSETFAEFFSVTQEQAVRALGKSGYRVMGLDDARDFSARLDGLLAERKA